MTDESGQVVARLETGEDKRRQVVTLGADRIMLAGKQSLFRTELDALDGDEILARVRGDELTSDGTAYSLKRRRRWIPVPWVLGDGDAELASLTRHLNHRIDIEVTGARPVPLVLLVVCCQWARLKAQRAIGGS